MPDETFREVLTAGGGSGIDQDEVVAGGRLSNGRLRVESATESVEPILRLMREHNLPPAEIAANPNALHELFLQSLAASKTPQNGNQA